MNWSRVSVAFQCIERDLKARQTRRISIDFRAVETFTPAGKTFVHIQAKINTIQPIAGMRASPIRK